MSDKILIDTSGSDENADWIKTIGDYQAQDLAAHEAIAGTREKHLPGQHDQSEHGNWAHGAASRQARPIITEGQIALEEAPPSSPSRTAAGTRAAFVARMKPEYEKLKAMDAQTKEMGKTARAMREEFTGYNQQYWDFMRDLRKHKKERAKVAKNLQTLEEQAREEIAAEQPANLTANYKFHGRYLVDDPSSGKYAMKVEEGDHDYAEDLSEGTRSFIENELVNIGKIASSPGDAEIKVGTTPFMRAYFASETNGLHIVNFNPYNVRTKKYMKDQVAHEFGHWIEDNVSGARERATAFLQKRTAGLKSKPWKGREREQVIKDKFLDPYIGKIYASGATEILSMGLEMLFTNPYKLATGDPEMFDLVLSVVQGISEK